MKNWKTTLAGAIFAIVLFAIQYFSKGTIDLKTFVEGAGGAVIGFLASDANLSNFFKANPNADLALQLGEVLSQKLSEALPSNDLLNKIHGSLDTLNQNVNALPAATASAVTQALPSTAAVALVTEATPVPEKPAVPLYNQYSGKLLTEDPLVANN